MAAYSLDTLLQRWALHQVTSEQAIGQMLLILQQIEARLLALEKPVAALSTPPPVLAPPNAAPPPRPLSRKRPSQGKVR